MWKCEHALAGTTNALLVEEALRKNVEMKKCGNVRMRLRVLQMHFGRGSIEENVEMKKCENVRMEKCEHAGVVHLRMREPMN